MAGKKHSDAPTLFLDRDGTINVDLMSEYLNTVEKAKLIPGAGRALVRARDAGFKLAVITNQAGVAKGLTPKEALPLIHRQLEKLIAEEAGLRDSAFAFDDIRICMHHPDEKCACRKPGTRMLEESAAKLHSDLKRSFFIGDRETDLLSATRFGLRAILVLTGHGKQTAELLKTTPEAIAFAAVATLEEAVELAIRDL